MKHIKLKYLWILLGIFCIINSICVSALVSGTKFYLVWLAISLIFFALAICSYLRIWMKLPTYVRRIITIFIIAGAAVFLFVEGCILSCFNYNGKENLDYIIVLGAQVYEDKPSPVLKFRLDTAIDYLKENPDTKCIVTGAQGINEPFTEAQGMADYLTKNGISTDRIILEKDAVNTVENISNSIALINNSEASIGIVTNNFHVFRAVRIAKKQGIQEVSGIAAPSTVLYLPNNMFREFLAVIKDFVKHNI